MVSLKTFNPTRYAPLSLANPLPLDDPNNCATVAADSSRSTENGLAWDIFSQTAAWLRSQDRSNPLRRAKGFKLEQVYGFGYSQTGGYLYNYINGIHPIETARNGGLPLFDAYVVAVAGGAFVGAVPINQCRAAPPLADPRRQFSHVGVPIVHIMSQSDYLIGIADRRADSDVWSDRFRHYEMAGAGHATPEELYSAAAPADIVAAGRAVPPLQRGVPEPRPVGAAWPASAALGAHPGGERPTGARRLRQCAGRPALALRRRAHGALERLVHRGELLLHRGARAAVRGLAAAAAVPQRSRLRPARRGERAALAARAVPHAGRCGQAPD
jgi:hypothetical protein